MPGAAMTPACRIPPPRILRIRRARSTNAADPQIIDPTGAASPFDRHNCTDDTCCVQSVTGRPIATAALNSRAPSRCTGSECLRAMAATCAKYSGERIAPPQRLCVFSRQITPGGAQW